MNIMEELKDLIDSLRVENHECRTFIPQNSLFQLLTREKIEDMWSHIASASQQGIQDDVVTTIMGGARRIFAILILCDHPEYIINFIKTVDQFQPSELDHRLPFDINTLQRILPDVRAEKFHKLQWEFSAPHLSSTGIPRCLESKIILPFSEDRRLDEGGFGVVYSVKMQDDYHRLGICDGSAISSASSVSSLIRKELLPHAKDYEVELRNLSLLKLLKHPNIIRLLSCYTYRDSHNFIFPRASDGDLGYFMSEERSEAFKRNESFFVALSGIASALHSIHHFSAATLDVDLIGCHHDLKPKNILVEGNRFLLADFGQSYSEHNIVDEAKSQLKAEISHLTSELGHSALVVQTLKGQLADILLFEADWTGAENLQEQVIESYKQTLGDTHPTTLSELHRLSFLYGEQDRWDEAEQLQIKVLATEKEFLDKNHAHILISMEYLATIYHVQGRSEEAEQLQVEVLQVEKQVFGEDHRRTLLTMDGLTATYWGLDEFEKAQRLHLQVVEIAKRVLGEEHPETMGYVENLAAALRDQGSLREAEDLELRLLELRKRVLGHEHHSTIRSVENLAKVYMIQKRLEEAESLNVQVLQVRRRALGEEHVDTILAMHDLEAFYISQERFDEAEELELKLIEKLRRTHGSEHPKTLDSMMWLATTYKEQKRWAEAQQLFITLLEAYNRVLGEEDWETIICMHNIARMYYAQQLWDQSEYWELQAIDVSKRALDSDMTDVHAFHAFTVSFMEGLAFTYKQKGDTGEAIRLLEDVKSERLAYKGPDDAITKFTAATLKEWAQELEGVD
jgi:hypothetical protein